jgi:N-methylhydantoinase B
VAGIPKFPHSCSNGTIVPANRLINMTQSTFAQIGDGWGVAEGGMAMGIGYATLAGPDPRREGASFVHFITLGNNGGPASAAADGWLTYCVPDISGLLGRDSVEVFEHRFPVRVDHLSIAQDTGGPGRFRGAPGMQLGYAPTHGVMTIAGFNDGYEVPAAGVRGGMDGNLAIAERVNRDGYVESMGMSFFDEIGPGEMLRGVSCGGGGYGKPSERDPESVLEDVEEGLVSIEQARDVYLVELIGSASDESLEIDGAATARLRSA